MTGVQTCALPIFCTRVCFDQRFRYQIDLISKAILDFPGKAFALVGNPGFEVVQGTDWAGIILTDNDTSTSSV